jgi:hypothetical protein
MRGTTLLCFVAFICSDRAYNLNLYISIRIIKNHTDYEVETDSSYCTP